MPNTRSLDLDQLARYGAQARLEQLKQETAAIQAFLNGGPRRASGAGPAPANGRRRRRRKISAAGRAAISAAQKKRWAAIKKKKAASA